jgi:hypothetical protein
LKLEEANCIIFANGADNAVNALAYNSFCNGSLAHSRRIGQRAAFPLLVVPRVDILNLEPTNQSFGHGFTELEHFADLWVV